MKWPFYDSMSFMKEMDLNMQKTESNSCLTNNSSDDSFDDEGHLGTKSSAKKRKSKDDIMIEKMIDALAKEPDKIGLVAFVLLLYSTCRCRYLRYFLCISVLSDNTEMCKGKRRFLLKMR